MTCDNDRFNEAKKLIHQTKAVIAENKTNMNYNLEQLINSNSVPAV